MLRFPRPQRCLRAGFVLALGLCTAAAEAGRVYKWTDEQGVTHYAEELPKGQKGTVLYFDTPSAPAPKPRAGGSRKPAAENATADDFHGLPLPANSRVLQRVDPGEHPGILVYLTTLGPSQVVEFYRRNYGMPDKIDEIRKSLVLVYRKGGKLSAKVSVGPGDGGTQVDIRVEP